LTPPARRTRLRRLRPFGVRLLCTDPHRLPVEAERELGLTFFKTTAAMVPHCDVVTVNAPLHPAPRGCSTTSSS